MNPSKHKLNIDSKIIFLDIDGVLNTQQYAIQSEERMDAINPVSVSILNKMLEVSGAQVVVSSSWRMCFSIEELTVILQNKGLRYPILDYTPVLDSGVRGQEISKWIDTNKDHGLWFNEYLILDDDSDMLYWQRENFVHTPNDTGLTPNIAYRAINRLRGKRNWVEDDIIGYESDYCLTEYMEQWVLKKQSVEES